jgi:DNA-binding transcriptional LysR family regulator
MARKTVRVRSNQRRKTHRRVASAFDELAAATAYLQVVKARGFTTAARALGKSVSSLSRIVAGLEEELGAQLLVRTTRRMHVTEAGALYAQHAEALLATQRAARDAVAELTGGVPRGHLRVSMPVSVGERLLGPRLPELRRRYPELRLELELSDRNVPLVQGGFDLALRVGRMQDSSLRAVLLGKVPVRLVASPAYLARRRAPKVPADLAEHDCITLGATAGPVEWSFHPRRGGAAQRVEVEGIIHTTSPPLAAQAARDGLGLVRTIEWIVVDWLRTGELVEVMPAWSCDALDEGGLPVFVVFSQSAGVEPPLKSRVFVDFIRETMPSEVAWVRKNRT